ncbi:hypothetical protein D3C87_1958180 [compost metagenome]
MIIDPPIAASIIAVPKSGCSTTKTKGMPKQIRGIAISLKPMPAPLELRFAKIFAMNMIRASFMVSEG